jgi:hypothetical protein
VRRIVTQRHQHPDAEAAHEVSGHAEDTDIFPNRIFRGQVSATSAEDPSGFDAGSKSRGGAY